MLVKTRETHRGQYLIVDFNYGLARWGSALRESRARKDMARTNPLVEAVRYGCKAKGINQSVHFESGDLWVIWTDILTVSAESVRGLRGQRYARPSG